MIPYGIKKGIWVAVRNLQSEGPQEEVQSHLLSSHHSIGKSARAWARLLGTQWVCIPGESWLPLVCLLPHKHGNGPIELGDKQITSVTEFRMPTVYRNCWEMPLHST